MRFEELLLRIPGDEFRIRFHERMTVLSGIGLLERQAMTDSIVGAVTGEADATTLTYVDDAGRRVNLYAQGGHVTATFADDGTPAVPPLPEADNRDAIRSVMVLQAGDLGLATTSREDDPPELVEARATLAELTEQLRQALAARDDLDKLRAELEEVNAAIHKAEDEAARLEYARVLADLEKVRAEAAALQSGNTGVEADRHLLASADETRELAARWSDAATRLLEMQARFADTERLDAATLEAARSVPADQPRDLGQRLAAVRAAQAEYTDLEARLRDLAVSKLPEPSQPEIAELARVEQDLLWTTHARALRAAAHLDAEQVALGGLSSEGPSPVVVEEIETAHTRLEAAEAVAEQRKLAGLIGSGVGVALLAISLMSIIFLAVPAVLIGAGAAIWAFVLPRREVNAANAVEQRALDAAGAPTWLAFHMRRVDAVIDPEARERLEVALLENRLAITAWRELAADVDLESAAQLEDEIRSYAEAVASLGDAAGEIENLRSELSQQALPTLEAAQQALIDACRDYALDNETVESGDLDLIERMVNHQIELGRVARLQTELEAAEAKERELAARLNEVLLQLGFGDGTLEARVGALDWAVGRAAEREDARARARSREEIEDDLVRLQAEARRLRRPEWASVTAADADVPDVETLHARKDELEKIVREASRGTFDVDRVADRHSAMERRVAALEAQVGGLDGDAVGALADIQQYLLTHLTDAAKAGASGEAVPVVLDEVFARIPAERKWDLLDLLYRLADETQIIYLTDDAYVGAWARRQAANGAVTLLEPIAESV